MFIYFFSWRSGMLKSLLRILVVCLLSINCSTAQNNLISRNDPLIANNSIFFNSVAFFIALHNPCVLSGGSTCLAAVAWLMESRYVCWSVTDPLPREPGGCSDEPIGGAWVSTDEAGRTYTLTAHTSLPPDFASAPEIGSVRVYARQPFVMRGWHDTASDRGVTGWACHSSDYSRFLTINVYIESRVLVASGQASDNRPDVAGECGSVAHHGFNLIYTDQSLDGREHDVSVYGVDPTTGEEVLLNASPRRVLFAQPLYAVKDPLSIGRGN